MSSFPQIMLLHWKLTFDIDLEGQVVVLLR